MKTADDLIKSREARESIIDHFGSVPQSILVHDRSIKALDVMAERRNYGDRTGEHSEKYQHLSKAFGLSHCGSNNTNCRRQGPGHDRALSRFPQSVGKQLLLLYTHRGDTVIDPFAGHNSRMELCWRNNRNYIGCDISSTFQEANREILKILSAEKTCDLFGDKHFTATVELHICDSKNMPLPDNCGDFTITSPPYWDIEYYGEEPEQLGYKQTYPEFLQRLFKVMVENYRVLKPGSFCVWCVNDFREDGVFYSFHEDTASLMRMAGFIQHDIAITDLGQPIRAAFATQVVSTKILPKRHEYCLIFKKTTKTNHV